MDKKIEEILEIGSSEDVDNPVEPNGKKYPALRTIATFYKVLAYMVVIVAFISFLSIFVVAAIEPNNGIYGVGLFFFSCFFLPILFITFLAFSEGIMLFVDMANDLSEIKTGITKTEVVNDD